jgi:DNA polymerase II small subunit/DNA polymerase delta subunit B
MIFNKRNSGCQYSLTLLIGAQVLLLGCSPQITNSNSTQINNSSGKEDFTIAVLPDTQYYSEESQGGNKNLFIAQTDWIVKNQKKENIAYVIHVGDIVDKGDSKPEQWDNAVDALYRLEKPLPGLPYGIPYGVTVGNHDQYPSQFPVSGKTYYYNKYFGVKHLRAGLITAGIIKMIMTVTMICFRLVVWILL